MIVFFSFTLMFALYWPLALIMLIMVPAFATLYLLLNFWNRKTEREVMEASADVESQLVESLAGIKTIKHFGLEEFAGIQTETRFTNLLYKTYRSALNHVFSANTSYFISGLFTVILLWSGSYFVIGGAITPGELMSFYTILGYFTAPVSALIGANREMQNALIAADRLFEIMDLEREEMSAVPSLGVRFSGDIRFRDILFSYGPGNAVLHNLNLVIPHGKITAILGESGSGKSTLAYLLQRMYPLQKGQIRIGNKNLESMPLAELRKHIGFVPQQIHLFSGTILDNIAVGDPSPTYEYAMKLCFLLGMDSFLEGLPNGLMTRLGENGMNLSGGQRQRIAIARALYGNPDVLVLDEATSSLDSTTEQQIQEALISLRKNGKTIIQIAHRLGTVVFADKIVVLRNGRVLEEGTHEELFQAKSCYYRMWQRQMPGISIPS
jgi:ATP-binding cassette subfamily B protein